MPSDTSIFNATANMKRGHESVGNGSDSASNDDAFDDGDDLMARAADMMDFDNNEDDSDSDGSSAASQEDSEMQEELDAGLDGEEQTQQQPARKKQKASNGTRHEADEPVAGDEVVASSMLQLQVRSRLFFGRSRRTR